MNKVFYHSSDPDGWCSGAILAQKYPEAELYGINYGEEFPWEWITPQDEVWMLDYSLQPFTDMIKLYNCSKKLIWIDHHISAIKAAEEYTKTTRIKHDILGIQKDGRGACELVWKYVFPTKPIPLAVHLIASYDVWNHSDPRTVPFIYGLRSFNPPDPTNGMLWKTLLAFSDEKIVGKLQNIIDKGSTILDYLNVENADYVKAYSFETEIHGYRVIACNRGISGKKLFDSVWDSNKYDIACTFCRLPSKRWTVSLYSDKPDVDVSKIAVAFGGGGHRGASGMQVDELPFCY
jgi:oligoribonuclease NrnB/cAMP/cGMP phosphodiesterase (DHH superfamily)